MGRCSVGQARTSSRLEAPHSLKELGFKVEGLGVKARGLGFRIKGLGVAFRIKSACCGG